MRNEGRKLPNVRHGHSINGARPRHEAGQHETAEASCLILANLASVAIVAVVIVVIICVAQIDARAIADSTTSPVITVPTTTGSASSAEVSCYMAARATAGRVAATATMATAATCGDVTAASSPTASRPGVSNGHERRERQRGTERSECAYISSHLFLFLVGAAVITAKTRSGPHRPHM